MNLKKLYYIVCSLFILTFIACEIGLGPSVDTRAPTVSIDSPSTGELLKDEISVSGSWTDDKSVTKVLLTLKNIGTEEVVFSDREAVLGEGTEWSATISSLPDGSYELSAIAYDGSGHTSSKPTCTFDVDMTPPLFVMEKPGIVLESDGSIDENADTDLYLYGHKIQLTGVISDSHNIEKLEVEVYDSDGNKIELAQDTFSGFDANSAAITIACYYPDSTSLDEPQQKLYDNYIAIYGEKNSTGWNTNKTFSAVARVYDELGNYTEKVFLEENMSSLLKTAGISSIPDAKECMQILNGSYSGNLSESETAIIKSVLDGSYVQTGTPLAYVADSENKFAFVINSDADPTYQIINYSYTGSDDIVAASVNGSLSVNITYGIDLAEIYPSSLGAKFIRLDESFNETDDVFVTDGTFITDRDGNSVNDDDTTIDTYTYTLYLDTSFGLKAGNYYKVEIFGTDTNDNSLIAYNGNNYGFAINDSTNTTLSSLYYATSGNTALIKTGSNVYVNGSTELVVYGNYFNSTSGVQELSFKLGDSNYTGGSVQYSAVEITSAEDAQGISDWMDYDDYKNSDKLETIRSWKLTCTPASEGKLVAYGLNNKNIDTSPLVSVSARLFEIVYDSTSPSLALSSLTPSYYKSSESAYYVNNKAGNVFTFKGNASDDKVVSSVTLEILDKNGAETSVTVPENSGSGVYNWEFADISLKSLSEGAQAKFTVTDGAGNSYEKLVSIVFDVTGPQAWHWVDKNNKDVVFRIGDLDNEVSELTEAGLTYDSSKDAKVGGKYAAGTYGNDTSIKVRGMFTDDGSGVSTIYYKIFTEQPADSDISDFIDNYKTTANGNFSPLSSAVTKRVSYTDSDGSKKFKEVKSTFETTISGFTGVDNYMLLLAQDYTGNVALDSLSVYYDGEAGEEGNTWNGGNSYNLHVDTDAPEISAASSVLYSNATEELVFDGTASDGEGAGIKTVTIEVNGKTISLSNTTYGTVELTTSGTDDSGVSYSDKYVKWTVTIEPDVFEDASDGNVTVYASAVDNAGSGNSTRVSIATIAVDKTAPVFTVTAPSDADSSSDGVQVNGTISLKGTASDRSGLAADSKISMYYTTKASVGNVASVTSSTFAQKNSAAEGWCLYKEIEAGNNWTVSDIVTSELSSEEGIVYIIFAGTDKAGNEGYSDPLAVDVDQDTDRPVITLSNINDISSMDADNPVWLKNTNSLQLNVSDDDGTVSSMEYSLNSGTSWTTVTLSNGAGSFTLADGSHSILFRVKDSAGTTFTTSSAELLTQPKLSDGTNIISSELYISIDKTVPVTEDIVYTYYDETLDASSDSLKTLPVLGGSRTKFTVSFNAGDENGIAGVSAVISGETDSHEGVIAVLNDGELKSGKIYYTCTVSDIDVSSLETGTHSLKIIVTDKAGLETEESLRIVIDNDDPEIELTGPSASTTSSGKVLTFGTASGASEMYYALSPSYSVAPDGTTSVTTWTGLDSNGNSVSGTCNAVPEYVQINDSGTSWSVYFDGDTDSATTGTHTALMTDYLINYGITTEEDFENFEDIVNLYLWVKAYDEVGNVAESYFPIVLDPQGDRPSISVSYPSSSGTTLGGTVKIYGTVSDTLGTNIGVDSVWIQMISEGHGTDTSAGYGTAVYDEDDYSVSSFSMTTKDLDYLAANGYSVYNMRTYDPDGTNTKWVKGSSSVASGYSVSDYAALASLSGTYWNIDVNTNSEFDPDSNSAVNAVTFVFVARDGDGKFSLYKDLVARFDADNPYVSDLTLVQKDGDTVTASREYTSDMYVKGSWTLCGIVHDKDSISELSVGSSTLISGGTLKTVSGSSVTWNNVSHTEAYFEYDLATSSGVGSLSFTISATDNADSTPNTGSTSVSINYDNDAPVIPLSLSDDSGFNISSDVKQSNSWYTFGSVASEDDVGGVSQSGYAYTAFYFKRNYTKNSSEVLKLYDILKARADAEIDISSETVKVLGEETSTADNTLVTENNLYWFRKSINAVSGSPNVTMNDTDYVHVNSLVSIGGIYYLVNSVSGNTITLSDNLTGSYDTAYVALAGVVDNTTPEGESDSDSIQSDGYYLSPSRDDGDRMIESVEKSGTKWTWEANVCSRNIPDGPVEIVYVVFDNAGNCTAASVSGTVCNNAPRMAGFVISSDYDDDEVAETEVTSYASSVYSSGSISSTSGGVNYFDPDKVASKNQLGTSISAGNASSPVMTVRSLTQITPEIVGGNDAIYYSCSVTNGTKTIAGQNSTPIIAEGTIDYSVNASSTINIQTGDLLYLGDTVSNGTVTGIPFNFVFWDSTEGSTPFTDSQSARLTVYLGISAQTSSTPEAVVNPFYWNSINDNSIYDSASATDYSELKGHIELEADWKNASGYDSKTSGTVYDADPKVSGSIVFEGTSYDANLINEIYVRISGMTLGSSTKTFSSSTYYKVAEYVKDSTEKTKLVGTDAWSSSGYKFEIVKESINADGHTADWKLSWNTEKLGPAKDVEFSIVAVNRGMPSAAQSASATSYLSVDGSTYYKATEYSNSVSSAVSSTVTASGAETSFYRMDVVPYITKITTALSKVDSDNASVYNRTALGRYPVYMTFAGGTTAAATATNYNNATYETVTVAGFNLSGGSIVFSGSSNNEAVLSASGSSDSDSGAALYTFTVPSGAESGATYVSVTESGTEYKSINNMNNNDSRGKYGYEADEDGTLTDTIGEVDAYGNYDVYNNYYNRIPNGTNNNILTDNVEFDIWNINSAAARPANNSALDIMMKVNPSSGMVDFAFCSGDLYWAMANGTKTSYSTWYSAADFIQCTGFTVDPDGVTYGSGAGGQSSDTLGDCLKFTVSKWNTNATVSDTSNTNYGLRIGFTAVDSYSNMAKDRFKSQSIASNGTSAYIAYFDLLTGEIRFQGGGTSIPAAKGAIGTLKDNFTNGTSSLKTAAAEQGLVQVVADGSGNSLGYSGEYVSIGITSDNVVVMTWYDSINGNLMFAYNDTLPAGIKTGVNSTGWTAFSAPLITGGGKYCQLAVASDDSIHIAAYDSSNGDLKYVYLPSYEEEDSKKVCVVDSYQSIGRELTIDVASDGTYQIPYIGYYGTTPKKPHYAYLYEPATFYGSSDEKEFSGVVEDLYNGVWECTIVPTISTVTQDSSNRRINIGVWKDGDGLLTDSEVSGANKYTASYAGTGAGICYGNGSSNGVLGYGVKYSSSEDYVETAQKR
ncbi:hypothetical protein DYE49_11260 [Treponema rectale]|uniref:Ig-like domain (Group 3) n=1 Tax=Treponema rectale TaxID=744512 RepID=A0A840SGS2_9SPIR|nr:hypothetical protein [Treponema rectale]MBB5219106.1 hypothetical protein [Treponema rectale]QOS40992.1 hypothetical protein DYE49_11260 [Treponema rectale]